MASAGEKQSRPPEGERSWLDEFQSREPDASPGEVTDPEPEDESTLPSDLSWLDEYTGEARRQSLLDRWEERQQELKRATAQRLQELRAARAQRPRRSWRKHRQEPLGPEDLIRRPEPATRHREEQKAPEPAPRERAPKPPAARRPPHPRVEDYSHVPPPPPPAAKKLTRKPPRRAPTRLRPGNRRRLRPERIRGLARLTLLLTALAGALFIAAPWFGVELGSGDNTATSSLVPGQRIPGSTAGSVTAGPYFPVRGRFYYGEGGARFGASRGGRAHKGQDVFSRQGAPLIAVRDGVVVDRGGTSSRYSNGKGNYIAIFSPVDKRSYVYFHMLRPSRLKKGDLVKAGQRIGAMGCSGSCYGVHLHFEIRLGPATLRSDRKAIDPLPYLRRWDKADRGARKTGYGRY